MIRRTAAGLCLGLGFGLCLAGCVSPDPVTDHIPAPAAAVADDAAAAPAENAAAEDGPALNEWGGEVPQPLPSGRVGAERLGEIP